MKKIVMMSLLLFCILSLSGCISTDQIYSRNGQVVDMKVFDLDGNEILGRFLIDYCLEEGSCEEEYSIEMASTKLNSPAPEDLYYVVKVIPNKSYIIQFKVKCSKNLAVKQIKIEGIEVNMDMFYDYEIEDNYHYVSYILGQVNQENKMIHTHNLKMYDLNDESQKELNGTFWQYSRTYYQGVYFRFEEA